MQGQAVLGNWKFRPQCFQTVFVFRRADCYGFIVNCFSSITVRNTAREAKNGVIPSNKPQMPHSQRRWPIPRPPRSTPTWIAGLSSTRPLKDKHPRGQVSPRLAKNSQHPKPSNKLPPFHFPASPIPNPCCHIIFLPLAPVIISEDPSKTALAFVQLISSFICATNV